MRIKVSDCRRTHRRETRHLRRLGAELELAPMVPDGEEPGGLHDEPERRIAPFEADLRPAAYYLLQQTKDAAFQQLIFADFLRNCSGIFKRNVFVISLPSTSLRNCGKF